MNKFEPFTKEQAEKIVAYFTEGNPFIEFAFPGIKATFQVTTFSIAPFPDNPYATFRDEFSFFYGAEKALRHFPSGQFRVVAICEIPNYDKAVARIPYFFDINELQEKGITRFNFPRNILEN